MLGYSTIFTMFPVFSIVFDEYVDELTAINYVFFTVWSDLFLINL